MKGSLRSAKKGRTGEYSFQRKALLSVIQPALHANIYIQILRQRHLITVPVWNPAKLKRT